MSQSYEIRSSPWTLLWFRILGIFIVENIDRLGVFIFQTWDNDSFHLCLFDLPLIYQFYSIMTTLVRTICWNPAELIIWKSFHHHFKRIWRGLLIKIEMQLLLLSLLKYSEMLSQMITFNHFRCHLSYFSDYK